jgi:hypothetical protein
MIFGLFTLLVALSISAVAEFYSIMGLVAIFSAAELPAIIMGVVLGLGKLTAAVWLKLNWERASWTYKMYLVPAVAFLMVLTSMGIFGFLSKAHSDQSLVSGDVQAKIAVYDEKIKTAKENIDANRKAIKQMDEAVDQVMGRSQDEKGADKAVAIRRGQAKERTRLLSEITTEQKTIAQLSEERAPIAAEVRKVEAEVGPIKYIAALIYGDNPDTNLLEAAVRWVIILIVAVFDPLALVLLLAAQQSFRWIREEGKDPIVNDQAASVDIKKSDEESAKEAAKEAELEEPTKPEVDTLAYLKQPFVHFKDLKPMVHKPDPVAMSVIYSGNPDDFKEPWSESDKAKLVKVMGEHIFPKNKKTKTKAALSQEPVVIQALDGDEALAASADIPEVERPGDYIIPPAEVSKFPVVAETAKRYKAPVTSAPEAVNVKKELSLVADNVVPNVARSDFGTKFPDQAAKGDMFLRVDHLPNKLFKFNGKKWIEVDKSKTDSYTYDEQYILFLIDKLQLGEYELDQLSASEQELVEQKLKEIANDKT